MKDFTKKQYTSVCLELIEMQTIVKKVWAKCDSDMLSKLIDILRFYRQFAK